MLYILIYFLIGSVISLICSSAIDTVIKEGGGSQSYFLMHAVIICLWPVFFYILIRKNSKSDF